MSIAPTTRAHYLKTCKALKQAKIVDEFRKKYPDRAKMYEELVKKFVADLKPDTIIGKFE